MYIIVLFQYNNVVNYICYRCNKKFNKKSTYIEHLNRKIKCDNVNNIEDWGRSSIK